MEPHRYSLNKKEKILKNTKKKKKSLCLFVDVAVKEFSNQDIQTTDFIRESEIHAKLRHPNVVQLLAVCFRVWERWKRESRGREERRGEES
jgi:hypothetical protein